MRLPFAMLALTLLASLAADLRLYYAARSLRRPAVAIHLASVSALYLLLIVALCLPARTGAPAMLLAKMWMLFGFLTAVAAKSLYVLFDLAALGLGRLRRLCRCTTTSSSGGKMPPPLRPLRWIGAALALLLFGAMWWGALINRYRTETVRLTVRIPSLPPSFEGFRIAQISDLHLGTFGTDTAFVGRLVDSVNALRPDLIVFTGDIVNRHASELIPFVPVLSRLHAPCGVYSIMGNHDYGDYFDFPTPGDKARNLARLHSLQCRMGWRLLLNTHAMLRRGPDSLALIGVENVGDPPFRTYGNLAAAYSTLADPVCKILLTHNPAHFDTAIASHPSVRIALTLSGHTHAMQMRLLGHSPAAWRYPRWAGLYSDGSAEFPHQLYVNIGAGTVGMPMRLGATPEITLITLTGQ